MSILFTEYGDSWVDVRCGHRHIGNIRKFSDVVNYQFDCDRTFIFSDSQLIEISNKLKELNK